MIKRIGASALLTLSFAPLAGETGEFDEARVIIEINATDGDAGFQGIVDGEPWDAIKLTNPWGVPVFRHRALYAAHRQGMTELMWESAEPPFDELPLSEFLERFKAGPYRFFARTIEGGFLESTAFLTHHLPDGPVITTPAGGAVVDPDLDLIVTWDPVTTQFDEAGPGTGPPLVSPIVKYSVTCEADDDGPGKVIKTDVYDGTLAVIPSTFLEPDRHWKVEIGAQEASDNSTFREVPFCTHDEGECPEDEE